MTVNPLVVGSSPTRGANHYLRKYADFLKIAWPWAFVSTESNALFGVDFVLEVGCTR
jgi:hypothetical protein